MLKTKIPELGENQSENIKNIHEYLCKIHDEMNHQLSVLHSKTKVVGTDTKKIVSKAKIKDVDV